MAITSNRDRYVPFHTTPDVQEALKEHTEKTGEKRSKIIHDIIVSALQKMGYDVTGYELRKEEDKS